MIEFKCQVTDVIPFTSLLPFQGNLKQRSADDIQKLANSLLVDGLLMPFVIWQKPGEEHPSYVLDGHARISAIQHIAEEHPEVLKESYPFLVVLAETLEEAKKQLLQISSSYGKITPKGLATFVANAPQIKLEDLGLRIKQPKLKIPVPPSSQPPTTAIIRLRVKKDSVQDLMEILSKCSFVEIL